jgi:hypothetical protein
MMTKQGLGKNYTISKSRLRRFGWINVRSLKRHWSKSGPWEYRQNLSSDKIPQEEDIPVENDGVVDEEEVIDDEDIDEEEEFDDDELIEEEEEDEKVEPTTQTHAE